MISSLLEGVGDVLAAVGEVIVPSVDTALEEFKTHWNAIRYFYNDQICNSPFSFYCYICSLFTIVPFHLVLPFICSASEPHLQMMWNCFKRWKFHLT